MNVTEQDPLTGANIVLGFGVLNASTTSGSMEFGVISRGVIEIHTDSGAVELTVSNSFAVRTQLIGPTVTYCRQCLASGFVAHARWLWSLTY